eukprot:GHVR01030256.1.p1 GENE.GHVR01030256.1~~GHVR01030256.1.p1  ORF type:complete len:122 (-),score=12.45 GHVR01030256.1:155-520(-)
MMLGGNSAVRTINLDDIMDPLSTTRVVEVPFVAMHDLKAVDQVVGKTMSRVIPRDTPVIRSLLTGESITTRVLHDIPVDEIASCFIIGSSNEENSLTRLRSDALQNSDDTSHKEQSCKYIW